MAVSQSSELTSDENALFRELNDQSVLIKCANLKYNGTFCCWDGDLQKLKDFIEKDLKISGTYGARPVAIRSFLKRMMTVVKDNDEGFLSKALKDHAYTVQTVMNEHDSATPLGYKQNNSMTTDNPGDCCLVSTSKSDIVNNKGCSSGCKECKKSVNDWVGETDSRIKSVEDKVHNILTKLQNIKTQTLNSTLD